MIRGRRSWYLEPWAPLAVVTALMFVLALSGSPQLPTPQAALSRLFYGAVQIRSQTWQRYSEMERRAVGFMDGADD